MSAIRNLPISRKFTIAFGLVCTLCLAMGAYSCLTFHSVAAVNQAVSESTLPSVIYLGKAQAALTAVRRVDLALLLCQTKECTASNTESRQKALAEFQTSLKEYEPLIDSSIKSQNYKDLVEKSTEYLEGSNRGLDLLAAGKTGDALDLIGSDSSKALMDAAVSALNADFDINVKEGLDGAAAGAISSARATWVNGVLALIIVLLCSGTGMFLTREIAPRIGRLKNAVEAMADKDLTTQVRVTGTDELGRLGEAFNTSVTSIAEVLMSVARSAETLSTQTAEISTRAVQSAGNAHTESSKINQIAAAAQEMTATIGEISHNAESAAAASRDVSRER